MLKLAGKILSRVALGLLGVAFPLLLLEGGVRLMGIAPPAVLQPALWAPHPYLGWFHILNSGGRSYSEYGEFQADVHINARGLRDREIGYDNPAGAYRILVLGDSFTEALQVPLEETFMKKLETRLAGGSRPVEIINGGVGGWGTDQEAIFYLIEGFRYQPDLVLLCFFSNDTLNNYEPLEVNQAGTVQKPFFHLQGGELVAPSFPFASPSHSDTPGPPLLPVSDWLRARSALYRLTVPYLRDVRLTRQALGPSGLLGGMGVIRAQEPDVPLSFNVYRADPPPEWDAAWELTGALIRRLDEEVRARGARLAVVMIGASEQVYPDRWAATLAANPSMQNLRWDLETPNRRLAAILDKTGIPYLDLLPIFRDAASQPGAPSFHFRQDGHWTPAGHTLAAQAIESFLRDSGLLTSSP